MKKFYTIIILLLVLLLTGCVKNINSNGMTIAIPASQITQSLQEQFPITQNTQYGKITLKNPKALLQKGSDRITTGTTILYANALIPTQQGSIYVSGKPYFDVSSGDVYLREPNIERLNINGYQLGNYINGSIKNAVLPIINKVFRRTPIYKVNTSSIQGSFVKNVRVENGTLLVTFGL